MAQTQKMKLLRTMQILMEKTDDKHTLSATDLIHELRAYDLEAERKSIYKDIEALQDYGIDIIQNKGKNPGYYIGSRDFEMAELKLLVDAVQSSKFITPKKSKELIDKLSHLASESEGKQLAKQVFIYNRIKTNNEKIFYNVDALHAAIYHNAQISFHYSEWNLEKKLQLKKNGELYKASPWALTWDDENYYMVAYDEAAGKIKHYRVDKMSDILETEEKRQGKKEFEGFDLAAFAKKTFGMFGGKDASVVLSAPNKLIGVILDRFGTDIMIVPKNNGRFHAHVVVSVSNQFYGWVTGIGKELRIEGPERVREEYQDYLENILDMYL